jgi:hypothetical protein
MEMVNMYKEAPAPIFSKVGNAIEPIIRLNACERFQTK